MSGIFSITHVFTKGKRHKGPNQFTKNLLYTPNVQSVDCGAEFNVNQLSPLYTIPNITFSTNICQNLMRK